MGRQLSQFHGVVDSRMIEYIKAVTDYSAFDGECCYGLDGRQMIVRIMQCNVDCYWMFYGHGSM